MTEKLSTLNQFFEVINGPLSLLEGKSQLQCSTIDPDKPLLDVLNFFSQDIGDSLVVVDKAKAIGIITEQDLLRKIPIDSRNKDDIFSLKASDLMTPKPFTVSQLDSVKSAMEIMSVRMFRHIPVVDESGDYKFSLDLKSLFGHFLPIFKDYVHSGLVIKKWSHITVDNYSSILPNNFSFDEISEHLEFFFKAHLKRLIYHRPLVLDSCSSVAQAVELLSHRGRSSLLVTEFETELVGILTERDLLRKFFTHPDLLTKAKNLKIIDFMTKNPHMLLRKHTLGNALSNIQHYNYRNIILVDEDKLPLAIIELMDIFKFIRFHLVQSHDEKLAAS